MHENNLRNSEVQDRLRSRTTREFGILLDAEKTLWVCTCPYQSQIRVTPKPAHHLKLEELEAIFPSDIG